MSRGRQASFALIVLILAGDGSFAQAQIEPTIAQDGTVQLTTAAPRTFAPRDTSPVERIIYKASSYDVAPGVNLNDFKLPDATYKAYGKRLRGRTGLGRLLVISTCETGCHSTDAKWQQILQVNVAQNPQDNEWVQAATVGPFGLTLLPAMFSNRSLEFAVNGSLINFTGADMQIGNPQVSHYYIQVFENTDPCRKYPSFYREHGESRATNDFVSIDLPWRPKFPKIANGIVVGAPKVYDTYALTALRNAALQQMQTINPFVSSSLTNAYGTLQGVTRDQSYLNVQAQVSPPGSSDGSTNTQTGTCPAGYYPIGALGCAPVTSGSAASPISATVNTVTPTASTPPAVPTASTYNPLSAPSNVSVSSSDMLVEQVQLSAQLQVYQLLLQGAQSDLLLVQNSRPVAMRAQTTIGFPISIDPPRQFRHAVAEVRVLMEPFPTATSDTLSPISIVNLLPSQKTYNVAKITSKQKSFGGAAVIDQVVTAGVSAGKAKDRLYLAKDTDTVAIQYEHPSVPVLRSPLPEKAMTGLEAAVRMQRLDECKNEWFASDIGAAAEGNEGTSRPNSVLFGWQFRPVLGADYVSGGPRQVFAQLALPEALDDSRFAPAVVIETRWREYDEKRQVVGPVFHSSCSVTIVKDPVVLENPLRVHDTTWDDVGNGVLKVRAHGLFFSSGMTIQSGANTYSPNTYDGYDIQFFAPARDLLLNGGVSLIGENKHAIPLTIPFAEQHPGCQIRDASLWAIPKADGTSQMELRLTPGQEFKDELAAGKPLVLIGSDVYGLRDKPFQSVRPCEDDCVYKFVAPSDSLRTARNFVVRDISWTNGNLLRTIHFAPYVAKLSKYYADPPTTPAAKIVVIKNSHHGKRVVLVTSPKPAANPAVTYLLTGSDFKRFAKQDTFTVHAIDWPRGRTLTASDFFVINDSEALLTLPHAPKGKTLTIAWTPCEGPLKDLAPLMWDLTLPDQEVTPTLTSNPAFLYMGDSRTVTYSGIDLSNILAITFETKNLSFTPTPGDPTSIDVLIPSAITKESGHKELVATTKTKTGTAPLVLPIDVLRR